MVKLYYDFLKTLRKYFSKKNTETPALELPERMESSLEGSYKPSRLNNCYAGFLRAYQSGIVKQDDVIQVWGHTYQFLGLILPDFSHHHPSTKLVRLDNGEETMFNPGSGHGWNFRWRKPSPEETERMITELQEALSGEPQHI